MHCPFCHHDGSRVVDSRTSEDGTSIRRRRECPECGRRFTTIETAGLSVHKRSGAVEPFSRDKVVTGVRRPSAGTCPDQGAYPSGTDAASVAVVVSCRAGSWAGS